MSDLGHECQRGVHRQSFSYTPWSRRCNTVKPAFFASLIDKGLVTVGVLTREITFFTGFLQSGQFVNGARLTGLRSSKPWAQMRHDRAGSSGLSEMYS